MLDIITEEVKRSAKHASDVNATVKLQLDSGVVFVDATGDEVTVDNVDRDADCTVITTAETLQKMKEGKINPMMAVMTGKVKIKGDMGVAMKMQSLFS